MGGIILDLARGVADDWLASALYFFSFGALFASMVALDSGMEE